MRFESKIKIVLLQAVLMTYQVAMKASILPPFRLVFLEHSIPRFWFNYITLPLQIADIINHYVCACGTICPCPRGISVLLQLGIDSWTFSSTLVLLCASIQQSREEKSRSSSLQLPQRERRTLLPEVRFCQPLLVFM